MIRSASLIKNWALGLLIPSALAGASAVMTLKGHVFSVLKDEFVIEAGSELFHLRKEAIPADQRKKCEEAAAHEISIEVPMTAITRVRSAKSARAKAQ